MKKARQGQQACRGLPPASKAGAWVRRLCAWGLEAGLSYQPLSRALLTNSPQGVKEGGLSLTGRQAAARNSGEKSPELGKHFVST